MRRRFFRLASIVACAALFAWAWRLARPPASPASTIPPQADAIVAPPEVRPPSATPSKASGETPADARLQLERRCLTLAEKDPLAAIELAVKEHLSADDPGLLPGLMLRWASQDFDGAREWVGKQPAGEWRDDMFARLGYLRSQTDPLAAAKLVIAEIPPGPRHDEAIISVLHQWALRDSESARLWAEQLSDENLSLRALSEVNGLNAYANKTLKNN